MARNENAVKKNNATKKPTVTSTLGSAQYYGIKGTSYIGATKEELKAKRRELNHAVGVYEVETTIDGKKIEAASSNTWPYRITKTRAHPHNSPVTSAVSPADIQRVVALASRAMSYLNG